MVANVADLHDVSINRKFKAIDQRPAVVLRTHCRPLAGVVQLPSGGAGAAAGWSALTAPAVCCTGAAGVGAPNCRAVKSAAWSAIPLFLYELCAPRSRPPGKQTGSPVAHSWRVFAE